MQPLLITSLVALLSALFWIRSLQFDRSLETHLHEFWKTAADEWMKRCGELRSKYDAQVVTINKLQVDNALLKASLKQKHLRVPKL